MAKLFSIALFFVLLREALEVSIVVSVLLSFISRSKTNNKEFMQRCARATWLGTLSAFLITLAIGGSVVYIFYTYGNNVMQSHQLIWEAVFGFVSSIFILATGIAFLKGQYLYDKLDKKLGEKVIERESPTPTTSDTISDTTTITNLPSAKVFFWIPFLTVLREGLESVLLVGGVSFGEPATTIPLSVITGLICGCTVGYALHRASGRLSLKWFFILGSYILFIMAAGIFSRSIGKLEDNNWIVAIGAAGDSDSLNTADPRPNIWYLSEWNEGTVPGFGVLNSLVGYRHTASIGTILGYIGFWVVLCLGLVLLKYRENRKKAAKEALDKHIVVGL